MTMDRWGGGWREMCRRPSWVKGGYAQVWDGLIWNGHVARLTRRVNNAPSERNISHGGARIDVCWCTCKHQPPRVTYSCSLFCTSENTRGTNPASSALRVLKGPSFSVTYASRLARLNCSGFDGYWDMPRMRYNCFPRHGFLLCSNTIEIVRVFRPIENSTFGIYCWVK